MTMADALHVGTRKGLFTVTRSGNGWKVNGRAFVGVPVTMTFQEPATGTLHAALDHGHFGVKMHRSKDGGANWEERPVPTYPDKPEGREDLDPFRNEPIPWTLKTVWSLEGGHPGAPDTLWCGTIPGGLFRSDNGGDSWHIVESLWLHPERSRWFGGGADFPGIHSILIHPDDPERVSVAVSCGGLWTTTDGGASWENHGRGIRAAYLPPEQAEDPVIQDPHRVARSPARPDRWWMQHHNGIYRSDDDGRNWEEIADVKPSTFGFAVAVHPGDADRAWFIPAAKDEERCPVDGRLCVTRTRDGGRTFETLSAGLPQSDAYDIVFRHALAVDDSGERLAFGSTTGSLWVSEDSGEHWQQVNAHLPPVYSVRFAAH
jgi:photosystem II stability/assembly factor-like uncharacterized protein